jgi:hypothetical protein
MTGIAGPGSIVRIAAIQAVALTLCPLFASPPAAQPGYHCQYERHGDYGRLSADFEIPREGRAEPPAYLRWEAATAPFPAPYVSAAFYRMADGHYRIENGYASISWHVWDPRRRPLTLSLQLRSRPEAPRFGRAALAGDFDRSGGPFSMDVDWSDVASFARGARELHLVAINRERQVVATTMIDRTIFERAEPHIIAALGEIEAIVSNPAATCEFLDDLRSNDIIVTSGRS